MAGTRRVQPRTTTLTILSGAQTSAALLTQGLDRGSLKMPTTVDAVTALFWDVSYDGTTFVQATDKAAAVITYGNMVGDSQRVIPEEVFSFPWARLHTGANVAANRIFSIYLS